MKATSILYALLFISLSNCQPKTGTQIAYDILKKASDDLNKKCPIQIDSILKLENSVAIPLSTLRYNYILKFDTLKYDIREFEKSLKETTLNMVKTNPDGKIFRNLFVTFEYNYSDTLGNFLFRMVFKPKDYR